MTLLDSLKNLDHSLFNFFWQLANLNSLTRIVAVFFGHYFPYIVGLLLIIQLLFEKNKLLRWRTFAIVALSTILSRGLVVEIIRFFVHRLRPFMALNLQPFIADVNDPSFPSGHATFFFALAFALILIKYRHGWYYFLAAILISLGRVMAGVHWPSDILAGAIIGFLCAWLSVYLLKNVSMPVATTTPVSE